MENLKGEKASIHLESLTEFPPPGDITSPPKPKNLANISPNDQLGKNQGNQPMETTSTNDQVSKELFKQKPTDKLAKFKPSGSQTENKSKITEEVSPQSKEVSNMKPTEDISPAKASSEEHRSQYNPFYHRKPPKTAPQPKPEAKSGVIPLLTMSPLGIYRKKIANGRGRKDLTVFVPSAPGLSGN